MSRFQGKVAIVTGASEGIGLAVAKLFVREGGSVVLVARNSERLESVVEGLNSMDKHALSVTGDATSVRTARAAVEIAITQWGRIDILVNTVGASTVIANPGADLDELEHEDWQKIIAFNLDPTFLFCKAVLPQMKKQRSGKIVNVSSSAAKGSTGSTSAAYVAAKAGVTAMTRKLAYEVGPWNINVNGIAPSLTLSERLLPRWEAMGNEKRQQFLEKVPLRRVGTPEDQANVIGFLCSSDASFLTGLTIDVNGGQH